MSHLCSPYTDRRPWGRVDVPDPVSVARSGLARYRLSVYPPGTSDPERRDLAFARILWIAGGLAVMVVELMIGSCSLGSSAALTVVAIWGASAFYWAMRTRTIRRGTRVLRVAVVMGAGQVLGDRDLYTECCNLLADLEQPTAGHAPVDPVHYEAIWSDVYSRMNPSGAYR